MSDPFVETKKQFLIPEDIYYLDGNSLGPLTLRAQRRLEQTAKEEWGKGLIRSWNDAGWVDRASNAAAKIARLVGAQPDEVAVCDSTSVNLFKALNAALDLQPDRKIVLSDEGNFPTDLYIAEGAIRNRHQGHQLQLTGRNDIVQALNAETAVLMLTHVDFKSGHMHDMAQITRNAHEAGALVIWDLAHSAGAVPVDLESAHADFAIGCGYKFLNGGPGAPAFIYVANRHQESFLPALSGWFGHANPFAFATSYAAAPGIHRMSVGTPPVLSLSALDSALDVFTLVPMNDIRTRSIELSRHFIDLAARYCPELQLISPRDDRIRGSQVSFSFKHGYAAMQALINRGVIGDFRSPDVIRFGITPLYIDHSDIEKSVEIIAEIINQKLYNDPKYQRRGKVT